MLCINNEGVRLLVLGDAAGTFLVLGFIFSHFRHIKYLNDNKLNVE